MKFLKNVNIPFLKLMKIGSMASIVLFVLSIIIIGYKLSSGSVNLGIDFAGGIEIKVKVDQNDTIAIEDIRSIYDDQGGDINIQESTGAGSENVFIIRSLSTIDNVSEVTESIVSKLRGKYSSVEVLSNSAISGVVSSDNMKLAAILILVSWAIILLYITIRFDINYAIPAILSLIHSIVIVFAFVLLLNLPLTVLILSALLTLIGYSINDTIVVFDRIRENVKLLESSHSIEDTVNKSLNQIFSRTIMTSISTMLAALSIIIWGGDILFGFALTFFIGVCVGTYSSNLISTSLFCYFKNRAMKKESLTTNNNNGSSSGNTKSQNA